MPALFCCMDHSFVMAFGLMLVMEGVLPFVLPNAWRETFRRMVELEEKQIRIMGLVSMLIGLFLIKLFS